jgi:hypothetical protein
MSVLTAMLWCVAFYLGCVVAILEIQKFVF